ncbi:hypothetical protein MVEN_00314400 [Mycena venus]|uniref:Elongation factor 1-beta n=1 Tax=Mycena venus TaxID=2733690 RepID=A0A8H6Z351_9AGAR|nr:hypothetical protein MVEN_00314400 [Mycena venus]
MMATANIANRVTVTFSSPSSMANITKLEQHLASRSYVEGYTPSQADVVVFKAISSAPSAESSPHVARWYTHIKSYTSEFASFSGSSTAGEAFLGASSAPAAKAPAAEDDDDEVDLFGSDDENDAEAERIKAERVAEYTKKKAGKPKVVAKSVVTLDVKPWDDETDMEALEKSVRSIEQDGLLWGLSKLVAIGYGTMILLLCFIWADDILTPRHQETPGKSTSSLVQDEKVSLDELQEKIAEFEDYVQSSDVAAMQKL